MPPQIPATLCTPSAASRIDPKMIILIVGSTRYTLNKAMLSLHSTGLRNALAAEPGILICPDWDVGAFEIFIDWIYTRTLPTTYQPTSTAPPQPLDGDASIRIYIFARGIGAAEFRAAIEQHAISFFVQNDYYCPLDTVNLAFAALPEEDAMLGLLVDAHCRSFVDDAQGRWEMGREGRLPGEFLVRVVRRYASAGVGRGRELNACDYHGHGEGGRRKRKRCETEGVEKVEECVKLEDEG